MPTSAKRGADAALREALGPLLADQHFIGRLPHWYRAAADGSAWVVSTQHDRYGGGFRAELGWLPPRRLFPKLEHRPEVASGIKAEDIDVPFRLTVPGGDFVRYGTRPLLAANKVAAAVRKRIPAWFETNERIGLDLGRRIDATRLAKLERTIPWVELWIEQHADVNAARAVLRRKLERARHTEERAWIAFRLAEHGDKAAYQQLVELLDDPAANQVAAHALAEIRGWPFRWTEASVEKIKARVVARATSRSG